MPFSKQKITGLITLVQKTYPGWTNFSDLSYINDETAYKRDAIAKAQELLSEAELSRLLKDGNLDEITSRLKKIGQATNLLWNWVPSQGDLAILENNKVIRRRSAERYSSYSMDPIRLIKDLTSFKNL